MPSSPDDLLHETLTSLRTDLDRAPLADPTAVRRRGQARSRHQAAGVLAAAAAVVAVVVGSALGLTGTDRATSELPAGPSPTASPLALAADPFLLPGDVTDVGPYAAFRRSPDPVEETQSPLQCIPRPATLGAAESRAALYFSDLDARFLEHVLRFRDEAGAGAAVSRLATAFASCGSGPVGDATVADTGPERTSYAGRPLGRQVTETLHATRLTTPTTDGEVSYYELGVARHDNVVVVLEWSSIGDPFGTGEETVWLNGRLATANARATNPS